METDIWRRMRSGELLKDFVAIVLLIFTLAVPALADSYKYTDKYGITFWVDDESKIPPQYRGQNLKPAIKVKPETAPVVTVEKPKRYTRLNIVNNQILVKVVLVNQGQKTTANMILDTGATSTIIVLAKKLGMNRNKVSVGYSKIADGSQVASYKTNIDYIQVDDSVLQKPDVVIMSSMGSVGADGLLGNSFLKYFYFAIDYDKQLLVWD